MIHIIGGGLQGCFFAIALLEEGSVPRESIRIYDPHKELLASWNSKTHSCGMQHLRSNSSHSIHPDFNSLRDFAKNRGIDLWNSPDFALPYHRPSLQLFDLHSQAMITKYRLDEIHIQSEVTGIHANGLRYQPINSTGTAEEQEAVGTVIYAAGAEHGGLAFPGWAHRTQGTHVFDSNFNIEHYIRQPAPPLERRQGRDGKPVIIGGGITAVQLCLKLISMGEQPRLLTRKPLTEFRFDFDPCYIGPKCRPALARYDDDNPEQRNARMDEILSHRVRGTIPVELMEALQSAIMQEKLEHRILADASEAVWMDAAGNSPIFATGFKSSKGDHPLLQEMEFNTKVPVYARGYPVPDESLCWNGRVFITGSAGMYRIGPAALNIIGAHLAWRAMKSRILED